MDIVETRQPPQPAPVWPTPAEEPSERECLPGESFEEEVPFVTPPQMPWPRILPGL